MILTGTAEAVATTATPPPGGDLPASPKQTPLLPQQGVRRQHQGTMLGLAHQMATDIQQPVAVAKEDQQAASDYAKNRQHPRIIPIDIPCHACQPASSSLCGCPALIP